MSDIKFLIMSDPHLLSQPGAAPYGRSPHADFEAVLSDAASAHSDAAFLVVTGDLADDPPTAAPVYAWLKHRLAELPFPSFLCIGNHDSREAFLEAFPEHRDADGFAQRAVSWRDTPLLMLDTVAAGETAGRYCAPRRAWLEAQLATQERPALIFMHHNPIPTHLPAFDAVGFRDMAAFGDLVGRWRDRIAHVFFGHTHLDLVGSLRGVPMSGLKGGSHQGVADFSTGSMRWDPEPEPVYAVCVLSGDAVSRHVAAPRRGRAQ